MAESVNRLDDDEIMKEVEYCLKEVGLQGAASVAWALLEKEAEKVTDDIKDDPKRKRMAELIFIRMMLDRLNADWEDEKRVHETGEEPKYDAGPGAGS